jgi:hypothetical protein
MTDKIICEYCNKNVCKAHKKRHQNSKECKEKQINIIETIEYKCKYCKKGFNLKENKNKHELNMSCNTKDILHILEIKDKELELKDKELELKDNKVKEYQNIVEQKNNYIYKQDEVITDLRNQLYVLQKVSIEPKNETNYITINNTININFNDIKNNLDKYNINVLSDKMSIVKFITDIFLNKLILVDKKKKTIGYYLDNINQKDIKCKKFLQSCAEQLSEINEMLCNTHDNVIEDNIMRKAFQNKLMIGNMLNGIEKFVRTLNGTMYIEYIVNSIKE